MEFKPGHTVGIDLGTTFSTVARLDDQGEPTPLENDEGEFTTPSMILLAESGHVIVGPNRMRAALENPDNLIDRIKREMGNRQFRRTFDGNEVTPEFISGLILKKLKQDSEQMIGPIGNAVITVPYYFNDARRKATSDAGRIAGLNVVDIINEPTAAVLAYAWHKGDLGRPQNGNGHPHRAMVYDLGGGTFDCTLVEYTPLNFRVLATDGDVHLGGLDWSDRIVDYVAEKFIERHGADPRETAASLQMLRNDCDLAKISLTELQSASVTCRLEGKSTQVTLDRQKFEELTADLLQRTLDTVDLVLDQARLQARDVEAVVLVGGSTLMPQISRALETHLGVKPYTGMGPQLAVAQGAAIHAAILEAQFRPDSRMAEVLRERLGAVRQQNVNSHGLGIAAVHPDSGRRVNSVMIPRNTQLPTEVSRIFRTRFAGQQRVNVRVIEGDAPDPEACAQIGNCVVRDLSPNLPSGAPIEVTCRFEESGRVRVRAMDKTGGREATVEIRRRGGLDDDQIDLFTRLASDYHVE